MFPRPGSRKLIIGMVHLAPLPGTPYHDAATGIAELREVAVESALALRDGGADGCLVQTVDRVAPAADDADPARVAAMALIVAAVAEATGPGFQVGVQIMRNAIRPSLAVARVAGGTFVRAAALVGATVTTDGVVTGDPHAVMEYRHRIDARHVAIVADIHSMHFRWLGGHRSAADVAQAAAVMGADAVSVGDPDPERTLELVAEVRERQPALPIILAGYTNHDNAARLVGAADGAFVGRCLERDGWGGRIDADLVRDYVAAVREA